MRLHGTIQRLSTLSEIDRKQMFALMTAHYENVQYTKFVQDLAEKDAVLLLRDIHEQIQGFTSFMIIETSFRGRTVSALYSGDTIVHQKYWGQLELFRVFANLFTQLILEKREPLYWFLLTKGIKTYSLLPLFFKEFYPNHTSTMPVYEQDLREHLAQKKFGEFYVKEQGIVRIFPSADRLAQELVHIPENKRKRPHVKFFTKNNPGYHRGDELVCLARISESNFTRKALRFVTLNNHE